MRRGRIRCDFSSAGFGAVPADSIAVADALDAALDRIKALPVIGEATSISGQTRPGDWIATARRGLFAFDWAHVRYQIEALPSTALRIDEIQDDTIRDVAKRVRIPVRFSQLRWIDWDDAGQLSSG